METLCHGWWESPQHHTGGKGGRVRTRIAPTPSGFLHEGNLVNMVLTHRWASVTGAELHLRIDSIDADRVRAEYVDDILETMTWLGVAYGSGPRSPAEAAADRERRIALARERLHEAQRRGLAVYACDCSRARIGSVARGGCPAGCRGRHLSYRAEETALRVVVPEDATVQIDGHPINLAHQLGDFIVWRRDDLPAYQWTSVVDDTEAGMTHILRGEDLRVSTAAQLFLAQHLPGRSFLDADIRHHPLMTTPAGAKLSKSQLGRSQGLDRNEELRERISVLAESLGRKLGILEGPIRPQ